MNQNLRYFAGGAAVLVLVSLANAFSEQPSPHVAKGDRHSGDAVAAGADRMAHAVQDWRYGAGTDLSAARPIHVEERAVSGAVASVGSTLLNTMQSVQGTPAFEFVDDNVLDPIVRHLSRRAIVEGQPGTRLSGTVGMKKDGQLVLETADGVVHEIIGAQDQTGASDPALLKVLSGLVGKRVTIIGLLDPLDPLPATDFVAWSLPTSQAPTPGLIGALPDE